MDKQKIKQIIINVQLEKLMEDTETAEDLGESRRIIEYFENRGYNVEKFKVKQKYREFLMCSICCN